MSFSFKIFLKQYSSKKYFYPLLGGVAAVCIGVIVFLFAQRGNTPIVSSIMSEEVQAQASPDEIRIRHLDLIKRRLDPYIARGEKPPFPSNALAINF
jgi:hypothetical protein